MVQISRRGIVQCLIATGAVGLGETLLPNSALAAAAETLRNSTHTLAQSCLHPSRYQDFANWERTCEVVWNSAAVQKASFHDAYASPAMYRQDYLMAQTRYDGRYMGVQNLPQTGTSTSFAPHADFNAAECLEVSNVLRSRDIVPIASSNQRQPPHGTEQEFSNQFAKTYQKSPTALVNSIHYVRDFCGCTGVPMRGWGYDLKAQPGIGRFMIVQV